MPNTFRPISLELREISSGKYSLVLEYEFEASPRVVLTRYDITWQRKSVIFSTHDRDFALKQAHVYATQLKVPLTLSI
jgi:hypothetical protein